MKKDKIFISIGALKERFLIQTIMSAITSAKNPQNISFGIFHQDDEDLSNKIKEIELKFNVKIYYVNTKNYPALGVNASRINSRLLREYDENFYLQVDAHSIFTKHWDEKLLLAYKNILRFCKKPIISMYSPWWYTKKIDGKEVAVDSHDRVLSLCGDENDTFKNLLVRYDKDIEKQKDAMVTHGCNVVTGQSFDESIIESYVLTAQLVFSNISIIEEVPLDPLIKFMGDEPTFSLAAWTRGYRIFAIKDVILYHLNKGKNPQDDWRKMEHDKDKMGDHISQREVYSSQRVADIMSGKILGNSAAWDRQSFFEYMKNIDVDLPEYFSSIRNNV